jgi:hypothetical protein
MRAERTLLRNCVLTVNYCYDVHEHIVYTRYHESFLDDNYYGSIVPIYSIIQHIIETSPTMHEIQIDVVFALETIDCCCAITISIDSASTSAS